MKTNIKLAKASFAAILLLSASACTGGISAPRPDAPTMLDFSYVPPSHVTAATANWGLEDY